MSSRTLPFAGVLFFGGMVAQTLACLGGTASALIFGLIWALIFLAIVRFFEVDFESTWITMALPTAAALSGTALAFFGGLFTFSPLMWMAPAFTAAAAGAAIFLSRSRSKRCSLCNCRIGRAVSFSCPRCSLLVCEQKCWNFEHARCALCEQNHVPILPTDGRWWDKRLGPRSAHGHCQSCQASGQDSDLRVCGRCGRPHCRDCWDYLNGRCTRCDWVIDDLPESLQPYVAQAASPDSRELKSRQ